MPRLLLFLLLTLTLSAADPFSSPCGILSVSHTALLGTILDNGHLRVDRVFLGNAPAQILIAAEGRRAGTYLVYMPLPLDVDHGDGAVWIPLADATHHLTYLNRFVTGQTTTQILGRISAPVGQGRFPTAEPLAGAQITVSQAGRRPRTTTTQSDGSFDLSNIDPGPYSIRVTKPGFDDVTQRLPPVRERMCQDADVLMHPTRVLSGTLRDASGHPVPGASVSLVHRSAELRDLYDELTTTTGPDGRYEFRKLDADDYYLGINLASACYGTSPFRPYYYPGTLNPANATIIHIPEVSGTQAINMVTGPRVPLIRVTGHGPRGPGEIEIRGPNLLRAPTMPIHTDGSFQIDLCENAQYELSPSTGRPFNLRPLPHQPAIQIRPY